VSIAVSIKWHGDAQTSTTEPDVNTTQGQRQLSVNKNPSVYLALFLGLAVLVVPAIGCGGAAKSMIRGRVVAGLVGQAVGAASSDERFDEPGIPGAKITILRKPGGNTTRARSVFTSTKSDEFGNFELVFANGEYPRDAVQVQVKGEGFYTSRSQTFLPNEGDEILCVVIARPGYVFPVPAEGEDERNKKKK
jgi:hypothetical protein